MRVVSYAFKLVYLCCECFYALCRRILFLRSRIMISLDVFIPERQEATVCFFMAYSIDRDRP